MPGNLSGRFPSVWACFHRAVERIPPPASQSLAKVPAPTALFPEPQEILHFPSAAGGVLLGKLLIYLTSVEFFLYLQELYLMIKEISMPKKEFAFGSALIECTRGLPFSLITYIRRWKWR